MYYQNRSKGFTLVELMVVIGIILLILSVLTASFMDARRNARDRERVADLAQLEFALNAYRELNRAYPSYPSGVEIGLGESIDAELGAFWDTAIEDPVNDGTYHYFYHSDFTCDGEQYVAILAVNMEVERNSNTSRLCAGDGGFENAYIVMIDGPLSAGDGIDYLRGNNQGNWWDDADNQTWNQLQYEWEDEGSGWWGSGWWGEFCEGDSFEDCFD